MQRKLKVAWRLFSPIIRNHLLAFVGALFLILVTTAADISLPWILGQVVDMIAKSTEPSSEFYTLCAWFLGFVLLKSLSESFQGYLIQRAGQDVVHDLRCQLFRKVETLHLEYFDRNPTGRILTRIINDIRSLSELFTASLSVLVLDAVTILGSIGAMFWVNAKLAAVVLLTFPLVIVLIHRFGMRLSDAYHRVRAMLSNINAFLGENIGAISTIQRLVAEKEQENRFEEEVHQHFLAQMKTLQVFATVQPLANILNGVAMVTLLGVGGYWVMQGEITIGVIVAFLGYIRNLFQPVRDIIEKYNLFLSSMVSAERVSQILDEPSESIRWEYRQKVTQVPMAIEFEGVSLKYPTGTHWALKGVSFKVEPGKSVALVGATGSGKSTILRLLLRYYEPSEGMIRLAGKPLPEWNLSDLRSTIGVVHQDLVLFQGTVRDNLLLGQSLWNDETLIQHAKLTRLWKFIEPRGGLDMEILEGGNNLSMGEKQLLSFTRILVYECPVLIFDEATASMDRGLEEEIMLAMRHVIEGRTSIVIAHRYSTLRFCNEVICLDSGRLIEQSSYVEWELEHLSTGGK